MSNAFQTDLKNDAGIDSSLVDSDQVQGTDVFDPAGKHIGTIRRLVIDKLSGRVVYTVAQFGGFLGLGAHEFTVPWDKLAYDTELGGFRTGITEEQLKNAPKFGDAGAAGYGSRTNEIELNAYYGSANPWE